MAERLVTLITAQSGPTAQPLPPRSPVAPARRHYCGWDGDRLIHTESLQHGSDTRHIEHTIYEPSSFTTLVRLPAATRKASPTSGAGHRRRPARPDDPSHTEGLALMRSMLSAMPRDMQQDAARHLRHTLEHGLPPSAQAMLGEQADSTTRLLNGMQAKLQEQEKEQHARIAIHHYHCDHLGTPMALTDQTGQVAWAAKLDPWGNVLQEYNPQGIHQAIRLPGQHHDRETGLYYNRHRYYDPVVGSYINQDPIGLMGGTNPYGYVRNSPVNLADPLGLEPGTMAQRGYLSNNRKSYPGLLGEDSNGVMLFDEGNNDFHSYNTRNSCKKSTSGCTLKNVSEGLMRYPAPGAKGEPIQNGQRGFAIPVGPVSHVVNSDRTMVVNVTENSHLLYPGIVRRWVSESATEVTVHTFGEGVGPMGGINSALADTLWGQVDKNVFEYAESCKLLS